MNIVEKEAIEGYPQMWTEQELAESALEKEDLLLKEVKKLAEMTEPCDSDGSQLRFTIVQSVME